MHALPKHCPNGKMAKDTMTFYITILNDSGEKLQLNNAKLRYNFLFITCVPPLLCKIAGGFHDVTRPSLSRTTRFDRRKMVFYAEHLTKYKVISPKQNGHQHSVRSFGKAEK